MTNKEIILAYNGIMQFQNMEQKKFEESGKKILSGKIQLAFSINKNKAAIVQALQPYEKTKKSIIEEYRDTAAERKAWEEEQKAAEAEKRPVQDISISLRPGKSMEEYQRKLNELAIQETDFEPKKVPLSLFEGLDLTSAELEPFIFMISED